METALTEKIERVSARLEAMGFLLCRSSAYCAEFLCEGNLLRFETEPQYPGLSASIKFADGLIFEFGALAQAIDPSWCASNNQQSGEADIAELEMVLDFLALHSNQIFYRRSTFEDRYQELVIARMAALGLVSR
jgi:hypothetical protein